MSALLMKKDEEHLIQEKIAVPDAFAQTAGRERGLLQRDDC